VLKKMSCGIGPGHTSSKAPEAKNRGERRGLNLRPLGVNWPSKRILNFGSRKKPRNGKGGAESRVARKGKKRLPRPRKKPEA